MGTREGALKSAAARTGLGVNEYLDRLNKGLLYCWRCQQWHPAEEFCKDSSRASGRESACRHSNSEARKRTYTPHPRQVGGQRVASRDGDTKQARGRVRYLVTAGLLPHPNSVPCTDCGHVYSRGGGHHEFDHHLGYTPEHHEDVEAVCTKCHGARGRMRRLPLSDCPERNKLETPGAPVPLSAVVVMRSAESARPVETVELPA